MSRVLAAVSLAVLTAIATPSAIESTPYHGVRYLMGTWCDLTLFDAPPDEAPIAAEAAFEEIARLERVMSTWDPDSELSRVNRAAGPDVQPISRDLAAVTSAALDACRESRGAFDPTIGPVVHLWRFDTDEPRRPSPAAAAEARRHVGCGQISLAVEPRGIQLPRGTSLDLGGIGKGYATDRALDVLRARGIDRAKLDFGSSSLAFEGTVEGGWPVVLADPRRRETPLVAFRVRGGSISSSGQRERSFVQNGRRYGHIFDPRTGEPVQSRLLLVTVIAPDATRADALSTALFVMGTDDAIRFVTGTSGVSAIFIEAGPGGRVVVRTAGPVDRLVRFPS
jgi:thiamine biosynthesis lipoprotein